LASPVRTCCGVRSDCIQPGIARRARSTHRSQNAVGNCTLCAKCFAGRLIEKRRRAA